MPYRNFNFNEVDYEDNSTEHHFQNLEHSPSEFKYQLFYTKEEFSLEKQLSLSIKKITHSPEISFGSNFMKEHKASFRAAFQEWKNIAFQQRQDKTDKKQNKVQKQKSTIKQLIEMSSNLDQGQINQFLIDLKHQQQFEEFLSFVSSICPQKIAQYFVEIAYRLWMTYVPNQNQALSLSQLIQFANNVTIDYLIDSFGAINLMNELGTKKQDFIKLLRVFCVTSILTITEYFQNPYYQGQLQQQLSVHKRSFDSVFSAAEINDNWPQNLRKKRNLEQF